MMFVATHHRRSSAANMAAWMVLGCACLTTFEQSAVASLIIRDYSESASKLAMPADQLLFSNVEGGSSSGSAGARDDHFPHPADSIPTAPIFRLQAASQSMSGAGGADGSSGIGGTNSNCGVLCAGLNEIQIQLVIRWLNSDRFQFVPFAPRAGLLRPPQR